MCMHVMACISMYMYLRTQDDDPLNCRDDDDSLKSDDEDKFETKNIIVCQFDKVCLCQPAIVFSRFSMHVYNDTTSIYICIKYTNRLLLELKEIYQIFEFDLEFVCK